VTPTDTPIPVVAAVIRRDGRYLLGRRPIGKQHGGLWEFPGGKIDAGETLLEATARELEEELALEVAEIGATLFSAGDDNSDFVIHFVEAIAVGEPEALEHSHLGWFTPSELRGMALAPSDARFVQLLMDAAKGG